MNTQERIKDFIRRAYFLDAIEEVTDSFVDSYWSIKEDLFNTMKLWWYKGSSSKYPKAMERDLNELNHLLQNLWTRIVYSPGNNY